MARSAGMTSNWGASLYLLVPYWITLEVTVLLQRGHDAFCNRTVTSSVIQYGTGKSQG